MKKNTFMGHLKVLFLVSLFGINLGLGLGFLGFSQTVVENDNFEKKNSGTPNSSADTALNYVKTIGRTRLDNQFIRPVNLAFNSTDFAYILDEETDFVKILDPSGALVSEIGNGLLSTPQGIAINGSDYLYVVCYSEVVVFTPAGDFYYKFGSFGSGDGQFKSAEAIAINTSGYVYIADTNNYRVQIFTEDGVYLNQFGSYGPEPGNFYFISGLAVQSDGDIFVADATNHRIQKFSSDGTYQGVFAGSGTGDGLVYYPYGICVDDNDKIYVSDAYRHDVQVFTSGESFELKFGAEGKEEGNFSSPRGLAVNSTGEIFVIEQDDGVLIRIQVFSTTGTFLHLFGQSWPLFDQFIEPFGLGINGSGATYVADSGNNRILIFSPEGGYISSFGSEGSNLGEFNQASDIAFNSSGNVFVADAINDQITVFTSDGNPLYSFGSPGTAEGELSNPWGIAINSTDHIFVSDKGNSRIQVFSPNGIFERILAIEGSGDGQVNNPTHIAINGTDHVYIGDSGNNRIQIFDAAGNFISKFGNWGNEPGQFSGIEGIAINSSGDLYVVDDCRVQRFKADGTFIGKWGGYGTENHEFLGPMDIVVHQDGNVSVLDTGNNRLQMFAEGSPSIPAVPTWIMNNKTTSSTSIDLMWKFNEEVEFYTLMLNGSSVATYSYDMMWFPYSFSSGNGFYDFTLVANAYGFQSSESNVLRITVNIPPPSAPNWVTPNQTIDQESIFVDWSYVSGADEYRVYVNGIYNETAYSSSATLNGFEDGYTYHITVTSFDLDTGIESAHSSILEIICDIPELVPPDQPIWISVDQDVLSDSFLLDWDDVVGAETYSVYLNNSFLIDVSASQYLLSGLVNGTFIFKLLAYDSDTGLSSAFSDDLTLVVKISESIPVLATPVWTTENHTSTTGNLTLTWDSVLLADEYEIFLNGSSSKIVSSLSTDFLNLENGTYYFTIVATNTSLEISSSTSAVLEIIVSIPPDSSTDDDDTNSGGIVGYDLYILGSVAICSLITIMRRRK